MTDSDPIARFGEEYARAAKTEAFDVDRCALATADATGKPSVRFVLLKGFDAEGFVFYTNFESAKAQDLADNPRAALAFHWHTTGVQVRVSGEVVRVSEAEADAYFATRPRGSQLGAWASHQSRELDDRQTLVDAVTKTTERFEHVSVVRPPYWGGFRITPESIEFWHNQDDRLHDRCLYRRIDQRWTTARLYP